MKIKKMKKESVKVWINLMLIRKIVWMSFKDMKGWNNEWICNFDWIDKIISIMSNELMNYMNWPGIGLSRRGECTKGRRRNLQVKYKVFSYNTRFKSKIQGLQIK